MCPLFVYAKIKCINIPMFTVNTSLQLHSNPTCNRPTTDFRLFSKPVDYYDKDGFELTELEQEYYTTNGYAISGNILNHPSYQQPWFIKEGNQNLFLDHSIVLHRCDFTERAREQLVQFQPTLPKLTYLLQCKKKWGLDFCLDYFDGSYMYEVIHIETDFFTLEECTAYKENIEKFVLATDWEDAAKRLIAKKDQWYSLIGFAQNDWKAKFFGFPKAELTHKAFTY